MQPPFVLTIWGEEEWCRRAEAHRLRVEPWVLPRLERQSRHESHPVEDFLFEYYPTRPAGLLRWHPGLGVGLRGGAAGAYDSIKGYRWFGKTMAADPRSLPPRRIEGIRWIHNLLVATASRAPHFGCAGLHEWAMVFRSEQVRHAAWPLRLSPAEIERVVSSLPVACTHYDAFRFFTPEARPLNRFQPTRESQSLLEQPACLHANMDLYKWATKLVPYVPSELMADCFELAREIRVLDMRASPYDFTALGLRPVCIETREGRLDYESLQRDFAARAQPLRESLAAHCQKILAVCCHGEQRE